jgi:hypothetical protein
MGCSLSAERDLRPSLSVTYQAGPREQFGLNDLQSSIFVTPHNANERSWGTGPIFPFSTATGVGLGTGRWSAAR